MKIGKFIKAPPAVMGVLNVTDDSFSDGGRYIDFNAALQRGREMVEEGADIVDVGGESTRPRAPQVPVDRELERVIPVIEKLALKEGVTVSCDTSKAAVAKEALGAGAVMINDVTGMKSSEMMDVVREEDAAVCIMHMKGNPRTMQDNPHYEDVIKEIRAFLSRRASACIENGIKKENIIVDPGIGFGKTVEHNLKVIANIEKLKFGFPLLVGASRKSFIGKVLNRPVEDRLAGSLAVACRVAQAGVDILRVHDVRETVDAVKMIREIKNKKDE